MQSGSVKLSWKVTDDVVGRMVCLNWQETGGPALTPPERKGFGTKLIERGVSYELGGSALLLFAPEGLRCTIEFPFSEHVARFRPTTKMTCHSMAWHYRPRRALIAEDSFAVPAMLEDVLTAQGFEIVGPLAQLDQVMHAAESERLHLAILDVNLQGREIYPVVDLLVERGTPVILAIGYAVAAVPARYRDLPRLEKPFLPNAVVAILERAVTGARRETDG